MSPNSCRIWGVRSLLDLYYVFAVVCPAGVGIHCFLLCLVLKCWFVFVIVRINPAGRAAVFTSYGLMGTDGQSLLWYNIYIVWNW